MPDKAVHRTPRRAPVTVDDRPHRDYKSYDEAHHDMTKRYLDGAIARLLPNREIMRMLVS